MAFTIKRAIEQWKLSAATSASLFSTAVTTIPFDTRVTDFADLSNSMSSGVLTLSSGVKADWSRCRCTFSVFPTPSTMSGGIDYANIVIRANSKADVVHVAEWTGWSHGAWTGVSEWFDHTSMTDLEIELYVDEPAFGLDAIEATTDGLPCTLWELEFA